jgi:hypothetical protein
MYTIIENIIKDDKDCKIFKYIIQFNENRPNGDSRIFLQRFKTLKYAISGINSSQIKRWRKLGLKDKDFFACLDDFYPHGRHFEGRENYFRKGIGKEILNELTSKILIFKPKIIYAIVTNEGIKKFLISQGYKSDYKNNRLLYKLFLSKKDSNKLS